jgi:hypothetical protein
MCWESEAMNQIRGDRLKRLDDRLGEDPVALSSWRDALRVNWDFYEKKLEARVRIELTVEVLQTSALPLGDRAG